MAATALGMIASMTGYGRGAAENAHAAAEVELRSVNGKGLHLKLRLPSDRLELEAELEGLARSAVERGSIHGGLRVRVLASTAPTPDRTALAAHLKEWRRTQKELGLESHDPTLSELLALPGAFLTASEDVKTTRAVRAVSKAAMKSALNALRESREREGARLARELQRLLKKFSSHLARTEKRIPRAIANAQSRMQERVDAALAKVGDYERLDLTRELIALADRADVREEVARLHMHLGGLNELLENGGAIGREFDFLLQEVHREVTTLGSKSADSQLSEQVVSMKLLTGQLKEQIANVE
ncbi:MAG: YicC family protein [Planctomycetes bacterium]|nr:YicC family protein [Planctomycetota bacterium]